MSSSALSHAEHQDTTSWRSENSTTLSMTSMALHFSIQTRFGSNQGRINICSMLDCDPGTLPRAMKVDVRPAKRFASSTSSGVFTSAIEGGLSDPPSEHSSSC